MDSLVLPGNETTVVIVLIFLSKSFAALTQVTLRWPMSRAGAEQVFTLCQPCSILQAPSTCPIPFPYQGRPNL
jgi:hypothetical protein